MQTPFLYLLVWVQTVWLTLHTTKNLADIRICMSESEDTAGPRPDDNSEWKFGEGEIIREEHEQFAPGGVAIGKSEYRIKWQLRREADGTRCYLVEKEEGGTHLYTAKTIEHSYEVIDPIESRVWDETGDSADE